MKVKRVLYIDDDPDDHVLFTEAVKAVDKTIQIEVTSDIDRALKFIHSNTFDYVFIDYRMPTMSGRDFLILLNEFSSGLFRKNVYIYSTFMNAQEVNECKKVGAADCLKKVGDFFELTTMLSKIFGT